MNRKDLTNFRTKKVPAAHPLYESLVHYNNADEIAKNMNASVLADDTVLE